MIYPAIDRAPIRARMKMPIRIKGQIRRRDAAGI